MGLKVTYLNIIKALYDKSTANIIFSGEKLKATSLRSGTEQGCPLLLLLFNIGLEILGKKKKRLLLADEDLFLFPFLLFTSLLLCPSLTSQYFLC